MSAAAPPAPPPLAAPQSPQRLYLEASVLVDLADPNEVRNGAATSLLDLVQRYSQSGLLTLATSFWAITECHSILYKKELVTRAVVCNAPRGHRDDVRYTLPPHTQALNDAEQRIQALLGTLTNTTHDFLVLPQAGLDSVATLQLAMRLAQEAGIWAPDCMHVALALESADCSILVSDDGDLLDKIECCKATLIEPYRQQQFSMLPVATPFDAYGVSPSTILVPGGTHGQLRHTVIQALNALGFN